MVPTDIFARPRLIFILVPFNDYILQEKSKLESRFGNFDQILTLDRVRFARHTVLDGVFGQHFSNWDWLVFDWGWVVLEGIDVALLVRLLHLGAPQAE